jgi:multidrug efflux system membrane fusion protein
VKASFFVLPLIATIAAAGCSPNGGGGAAAARPRAANDAVPVTVATVVERPMPIELRAVGTVEPFSTVGVRALVSGELTAAHFQEGQDVKKDDLLFTIDPRPFAAQLHQAEAALARDTAQAGNADAQVKRYRDLVGRGIATNEQLDQMVTNAAALQATVKADAAAVENATLQLEYATIRAPVGGRTGALMVQAGNVVKANDTAPLVVINQISPIYVGFPVPENSLADIRDSNKAGTLQIIVDVPGDQPASERGRISFIDNAVDRSTGTIMVKGTFPNADGRLWPGLFVNVVLTLKTESHAIVAPTRAVQDAPDGKYVYVVKADRTVESRVITVARAAGDWSVIASGLTTGETVVTDGQLRLVAGKRVTIDKPAAEKAAGQR